MKRTRISVLIVWALLTGVVAALAQSALAMSGRAIVPPVTLPIALIAMGAIVIVLALPIRRTTRRGAAGNSPGRASGGRATSLSRSLSGRGAAPVDPFYALRVVMLAKASSLGGAILAGASAGALVYLYSRPVTPAAGLAGLVIASVAGALVLLVCGLVAESMCRIPPEDLDGQGGPGIGGEGRGGEGRGGASDDEPAGTHS